MEAGQWCASGSWSQTFVDGVVVRWEGSYGGPEWKKPLGLAI